MNFIQMGGIPGGVEVLVVALLWLVIPFVLAYWVYNDGEKRGEEKPEWWALAVGGLGYLSFFGGLLALAVYVWQRD